MVLNTDTNTIDKYNSIWSTILLELSNSTNPDTFEQYFGEPTSVKLYEEGFAYVLVSSAFIKNKIEHLFLNNINKISSSIVTDEKLKFKFLTKDNLNEKLTLIPQENNEEVNNLKSTLDIDPTNNFSNFVVGDTTRFAYTMALKIADQPGVISNPFYIFGDVGLGKTHLMHAIGNYMLDKDVSTKVLYVKTDTFIEDYVKNVKNDTIEKFNDKYNNVECLLVDDIQMIEKAEKSQHAFFKIFDILSSYNKQIIITSDKKPSDLNKIMERLQSRFESGLVVELNQPDQETRKNIIYKRLLSEHNINKNDVDPEAVNFLAGTPTTSIRQLIGYIKTFVYFNTVMGYPLDLENCKLSLKDLIDSGFDGSNSTEKLVSNILDVVSTEYQVSLDELKSKSRKKNLVTPRHISMYLIKENTDLTLQAIASVFNKKDHSTVINACDKVTEQMSTNPSYNKAVINIKSKLSLK